MKKYLKLENLIYLTIIGLPLYLMKVVVFGIPTNVLEILMGASILWWIWEWKNGNRKLNIKEYRMAILLFSFLLIGLMISLIANKNYLSGLGIVKSWFILPFLFALVAANVIRKENGENIFVCLFVSGFIVSFASLVYWFLDSITYDGRLEGFFNSPNYLAMYLSPGIIVGAVWLSRIQNSKIKMQNYNSKFKIGTYFLLIIILVSLYLTYSYAAWIAIFASLLIIFFPNKRLNRRYVIISFLIAAVLFILLRDTAKFHDLTSFNERSSLASRVMIWSSAEKMLESNWLWGIGPGNFQAKYLEYQKYFLPYLEWAVPHPHNLFLAFWLYSGVLGLVSFLVLLVFWFKKISSMEYGSLVMMALGVMIYFLLHGLVDTTYFKNDLAVIFWLVYFSAD